jgi:drug/metabolite transporter (DMT)-like permease
MDVLGSVGYLLALFQIPLAIATAINLSTPLMLTAMAVFVLREDVRWQRWAAVLAGFAGVLLVIQPTPGNVNMWAWLALAATCLHALRDLSTRWVPRGVPSAVVAFSAAVAITVVTGAGALAQGWKPMAPGDLALLCAASAFLAGGYHFLVVALRTGEISVVASFRYTALLWALLLGFALWGDVPGLSALAGIAAIAASGLYLARR